MDILIWVVNSLPMTFSLDWFNLFFGNATLNRRTNSSRPVVRSRTYFLWNCIGFFMVL